MPPSPAPSIRAGKRTPIASDFAHDLRHPNPNSAPVPLLQRDPVRFWQAVSLALALAVAILAAAR